MIILFFCLDGYVRKIIKDYPLSVASVTIQNIMDGAMSDVLSNSASPDMSRIDSVVYDDNNSVVSVEVDTKSLNTVKTAFVKRVKDIIAEKGEYFTVEIPIGTLIGNEYTMGRGPKIPFKLQTSANYKTSLKSEFEDAGVNNTLHTIYLNVDTEIYLLIPWDKTSKTVKTNYILAQTVISGKVPDAYTNVDNSNEDLTNDLFDYRAEVE